MARLDPTTFHVRSQVLPPWQREPETFQELMADQLSHAPWLVVSFAAHAVLLLLLWLLLPTERAQPATASVAVQLPEVQPIEPPEPPEQPEIQPEVEPVDPTLQDPEITTSEVDQLTANPDEAPATPSAFDANQWNTAVGIDGGGDGRYGNRGGGDGDGGGRRGGRPQEALQRALVWLEKHQDADGRWDCDGFMKHDAAGVPCDGPGGNLHDVGVTGLAMLAFLGDGSTLRSGRFQDALKRGARWLRGQQQGNGLYGTAASNEFLYDHAIAAYAMCEAFGLSHYQSLRDETQRALDYLQAHRNPYSAWRYQPRDNENDTSVTGWCIMALESGKHFGLLVDDNALRCSAAFLDSMTATDGRVGYLEPGGRSSRRRGDHMTRFPPERGEAMTAVALFCRYFMGQQPSEQPCMALGADLIADAPPVWDERSGAIDHYYWYYATYAMYQVGGRKWTDWEKALSAAVVDTQRTDGNFAGSWDPAGVWGEDGGRVYSTAILALTLEAYYRYTKLVR